MPDTPTIHYADNTLYCWPTKLTFAPMLSDMIVEHLQTSNLSPSQHHADFTHLENVEYAQTPWDATKWSKYAQ